MSNRKILLGVNIDHVATIRQGRGTRYPDPIEAAFLAERAGADAITIHLREDRRHIQERDVEMLLDTVQTRVNLEMAVNDEIIELASRWRPQDVCLVPENRQELTTEGGLDVVENLKKVTDACARLNAAGCRVSLFIDPDIEQVEAARRAAAQVVEIHTGKFADSRPGADCEAEYARIEASARHAAEIGLQANAGHGLHYNNVAKIAAMVEIRELNIGHAIISRALMCGLEIAVRDMKALMLDARAAC